MTAVFKGFGEKAIPFLKALDFHQSREWFHENRALYESELREPLGDLVEVLTVRLGAAGLKLRGDRTRSLFRINRDVRFSKDKRPYNQHVSAILSPDGTKMEEGVLFIYFGVDGCRAAVAWWQPKPELLTAMRKRIAEKPAEFRGLLTTLKKNGLALDSEGALKRMPRGFEDVYDAELAAAIRNRHFVARHAIDPAAIHGPELADEIVDFTLRARPLLDWGRKIEGRVGRGKI
jgi:uncharacterized protein (TIGR02453 family)